MTFDASAYLDTPEVIAAYLAQIVEDGDVEELYEAIAEIAKAIARRDESDEL